MKVAVACVVALMVAVAQTAVVEHYGHSAGGGSSHQYRNQDASGHYDFGYDESHGSGGSFRRESGNGGAVSGSYGLRVADGRQRVVDYVADGAGFRANVRTNEPGVDTSAPAAASYNAGPENRHYAHPGHARYYAGAENRHYAHPSHARYYAAPYHGHY